ncbi:mechanosensitive ion channel protein [Saccharobesus litoralis]|uniref:Mechanosensitive ion channel protein n=2 Tax=Saccharobesus litoralis TaxID=2172099 RepID=A0A2S0VY15_9ALTE|nr:mechanosensitive ion channel protein [Saccharobesus litoralis]
MLQTSISSGEFFYQLLFIIGSIGLAWFLSRMVFSNTKTQASKDDTVQERKAFKVLAAIQTLSVPILTFLFLSMSAHYGEQLLKQSWLITIAIFFASLVMINGFISYMVKGSVATKAVQWCTITVLLLHMLGLLSSLTAILESIAISVGDKSISAYDIVKVLIFGALLFWVGGVSKKAGTNAINNQPSLDLRTKEVATKLYEIVLFVVISLAFLQIIGINITTLAVFGGAVGLGLGFGLQSIASNFISGLIILLDRSISLGDYVELEEGKEGLVREIKLRAITLETFDGKDIVVPNEKFISSTFTNWTHKDKKQRYRVDFSVAYDSDIHKLVPLIKEVVASHPTVISGEHLPIEEQPDCEIASFGDSGINMFVEFWMEGIDDGKNRVGGDLLLMILDTLRQHGFVIPFPQREVRML